jgi:hypothetical protein
MTMRERVVWLLLVAALAVHALRGDRPAGRSPGAASRPAPRPGVRLTMEALHQQGGLPLGWQLTPPPGDVDTGRRTFGELGCPSCHRVAGESFPEATGTRVGPDLSGMGSHHPPAYFVEAILNPDAVLIDAPGAVGEDGHSTMPAYPDLTVGELVDLVAYLTSLRDDDGTRTCHPGRIGPAAVSMSRADLRDRPVPPADGRAVYFAQRYDVLPGHLPAFEAWFATEGQRAFSAVEGLLGVETYVDLSRAGPALTSVFAFRDEAALRNFMGDPGSVALWNQLDGFIGPHGHLTLDRPLVYRAPSLSMKWGE